MSETAEKKLPVKNLERIAEKTFATFASADAARSGAVVVKPGVDMTRPVAKVKIFARKNGTFDTVWYVRVGAPVKVAQAPEKVSEVKEKPVHGLRSKDRKKSPKKAR